MYKGVSGASHFNNRHQNGGCTSWGVHWIVISSVVAFLFVHIKFIYSQKTTQIWKNIPILFDVMYIISEFKKSVCFVLRKYKLYLRTLTRYFFKIFVLHFKPIITFPFFLHFTNQKFRVDFILVHLFIASSSR